MPGIISAPTPMAPTPAPLEESPEKANFYKRGKAKPTTFAVLRWSTRTTTRPDRYTK